MTLWLQVLVSVILGFVVGAVLSLHLPGGLEIGHDNHVHCYRVGRICEGWETK
jgi:hypothetical protein